MGKILTGKCEVCGEPISQEHIEGEGFDGYTKRNFVITFCCNRYVCKSCMARAKNKNCPTCLHTSKESLYQPADEED